MVSPGSASTIASPSAVPGSPDTARVAAEADEDREQHLHHVIGASGVVDRASAIAPRVHRDVHLVKAQAVGVEHQNCLDLGVVVRVVTREKLDAAAVGHAK